MRKKINLIELSKSTKGQYTKCADPSFLQISTSSKFTSSKTEKATIKSADTTSTGIVFKKSTKNPSYARIRPYVTKSGKTTYGQWVKISL